MRKLGQRLAGVVELRDTLDHPRICEQPLDDETIGAQSAMELAAGIGSVHVADELDRQRTQPIQVEIGIACNQRVIGPEHSLDLERQQCISLIELEVLAETETAG